MAPTRRSQGALIEAKKTAVFSSGDLVLAKVLGFPAWPAKVCRPEDWDRAPDPEKYFVQFFGTQEIAFVASANTLAFTRAAKRKLLIECQGKTVRHFAQAVKEICKAFEEFQGKKLDILGNDGDQKATDQGKEEMCGRVEWSKSTGDSGSCPYSTPNVKGGKSGDGSAGCKRNEHMSSGNSCAKNISAMQKVAKSGQGLKDLGVGSKRKLKDCVKRINDSEADLDLKDAKRKRISSDDGTRGSLLDAQNSKFSKEELAKRVPFERKKVDASKGSQNYPVENSRLHADNDRFELKKSGKLDPGKRVLGVNRSILSKRTQLVDSTIDVSKVVIVKNAKTDVSVPNANDKYLAKNADIVSPEVDLGIKSTKAKGNQEAAQPLANRRQQELDIMSDASDGRKGLPYGLNKMDGLKKRRAIRLDDEDDDKPKTPVHGRSASKVNVYNNGNHESSDPKGKGLGTPTGDGSCPSKEHINFAKSPRKSSSHAPLLQAADICKIALSSRSPMELDSCRRLSSKTESAVISPKKSSQVIAPRNKSVEGPRPNGHIVSPQRCPQEPNGLNGYVTKVFDIVAQSKAQHVPDKASTTGTPNIISQLTESVAAVAQPRQNGSSVSRRTEDITKGVSSSVDANLSDPTSIKHLIAAAKNAQVQNVTHENSGSIFPPADIQGGSLHPPSTGNPSLLSTETFEQLGLQDSQTKSAFVSPSSPNRQLATENQLGSGEDEGRGLGFGRDAGGGSLSGDADAAVTRCAFEEMLETLSRTKESIGRATRLAINCAKHGVANEVIDLLVRKLENESNFRRRVDLFFLVDSITQCSHSQKGIVEALYISAVQAVLPRLVSAAAPLGAGARENRRQCLKVLRLWHERKIFPETVLRRFMDDIETINEVYRSRRSSGRPSRSERGPDDPVREIGTMQFDEYGSNASFQLVGLLRMNHFEDDEADEIDGPENSDTHASDASPASTCIQASSPLDHESPELGTGMDSPGDRHRHILESADGELEMVDFCGDPKDESISIIGSSATATDMIECCVKEELDILPNDLDEDSTPKGSPPLPLDRPPSPPPLPSSPPHPLSLSTLPTPPPPPAPTSSLAPRLRSQLASPFVRSPLPLQPGRFPPSLPPQGHQALFTSKGNQPLEIAVDTVQLSPSFLPARNAVRQEAAAFGSSRSLEHRNNDLFSSRTTEHNMQLQPAGQVAFAQAHLCPSRLPQTPGNSRPYNKPINQQISQHSHPRPYSSSSLPNPRMDYGAQKRWRASSVQYKSSGGSQPRNWYDSGRTQTGSRAPFHAEGYFHPPDDRLPSNGIGFQHSPNPLPAVGPASGHNSGHRFHYRSNVVNRWRPA